MREEDARLSGSELNLTEKNACHALLRAAMSGLVGVAGVACAEDMAEEPDPEPMTMHSPSSVDDEDGDAHGKDGDDKEAVPTECTDATGPDGGMPAEVDKEISVEDVQYTFAEVNELCDERGGYIQTHASCPGLNTCRGFSYGDWGEDSQLSEHTCSGVNGCAGLSCVDTLKEREGGDLTGEEIMKLEDDWFTERGGNYGPKACKTCHVPSEKNEETGEYDYDFSKLRMLFWPDSERDASNWTERSEKYQESAIAFGVHGIRDDGTAYSNMAAYKDLLSKTEIQRVVQYMRDFAPEDIVIKEINLRPGKVEGEADAEAE
jgi:hypothetical protein